MANIALCHFRVGETDGVSLEMEKWKKVLEQQGHKGYFIAGSQGTASALVIEELHYQHPVNDRLFYNAFVKLQDYPDALALERDIFRFAQIIEEKLVALINEHQLDVLIPNNLWSLGFGLPAGIGFVNAAKRTGIRCVAHHHDFHWERERYANPTCPEVAELLKEYFPPKLPMVEHVVINSLAQRELAERTGIQAKIVPNVFDFASPVWTKDSYNQDFRSAIGLADNDILILQATRIAKRKGIELAIDLVSKLTSSEFRSSLLQRPLFDGRQFTSDSRIVLVLAGMDESEAGYLDRLISKAKEQAVELVMINHLIEADRCVIDGVKRYSLWDAYVEADLVTYPSLLEGWGNQFLEGLFAQKPMVVWEYPVYRSDIKQHGFNVVSLGDTTGDDGYGLQTVEDDTLREAASSCLPLLTDKDYRRRFVQENYELAKVHYSYESLAKRLAHIIKL